MSKTSNLFVNERGFIYAAGAKICRLTGDGKLEFLSGRQRVTVNPGDLVKLANRQNEVDCGKTGE